MDIESKKINTPDKIATIYLKICPFIKSIKVGSYHCRLCIHFIDLTLDKHTSLPISVKCKAEIENLIIKNTKKFKFINKSL